MSFAAAIGTVEDFTLVQDFAVIMMTAGATAYLFRKMRLSPILGYLAAGILIGPYTLPNPPIENVHEVQLLADIGLVVLLFGLGLRFSWTRIRDIGLTLILIAAAEMLTMLYLGYWLGQLMGWETMESVFLGSALCLTSSALAIRLLEDVKRMDRLSSKLIVGISVAEDFAAIVLIGVLAGIAKEGVADLDATTVGLQVLKVVAFVAATVVLGTILLPRIMNQIHRLGSHEALLITAMGLCFGVALLSKYVVVSVATGAFLVGVLIGNTEHSKTIADMVTPIRQMFAAIYFVAIGMLVDPSQYQDFVIPAVITSAFFITGKVASNCFLTFAAGYQPKTALEVGIGMPQMGEFSLAIAKVGKQHEAVATFLYPVIAISSAIVALFSPFLIRSTSAVSSLIEHRSPPLLKAYVTRLSDWLQALRASLATDSEAAHAIRRSIRMIVVNILIVMIVVSLGSFVLPHLDDADWLSSLRTDIIGLVVSIILLALCIPSFISIWHHVRVLDDTTAGFLSKRSRTTALSKYEPVRTILRDSIFITLIMFAILWSVPFLSEIVAIGSVAIAVPVLMVAIGLFLTLGSFRGIHRKLEHTIRQTMMGDDVVQDTAPEVRPPVEPGKIRLIINWIRRRRGQH